MTFVRFEIINFDIFQKVAHDYYFLLTSRVMIMIVMDMNKDLLDGRNKELDNIYDWFC